MKKLAFLLTILTLSCFAEPAIYSLTLGSQVTLTEQAQGLTQNMVLNSEITTASGEQFFCSTPSGIKVLQDGLYRINFYQKAVAKTNSACLAMLVVQSVDIKRCKSVITPCSPLGESEIDMTQIVRLNKGQIIDVALRLYSGSIYLDASYPSFSHFTIEAL